MVWHHLESSLMDVKHVDFWLTLNTPIKVKTQGMFLTRMQSEKVFIKTHVMMVGL